MTALGVPEGPGEHQPVACVNSGTLPGKKKQKTRDCWSQSHPTASLKVLLLMGIGTEARDGGVSGEEQCEPETTSKIPMFLFVCFCFALSQ